MKNTKLILAVAVFVAVATMAAHAQTQIFVPGNATGCFGSPNVGCAPLTAAITVGGPGTITVTYIDGLVSWGNGETGPNGTDCLCRNHQFPLHEARGIGLTQQVHNLGALVGVFVPQSRVDDERGFQPVDGTKNMARAGVNPGWLFFIGEGKTFEVTQAGTLFLGINDTQANDNSGGYTVEVTGF
ncbi:MAG TPA: hypothetical protein VH437_08245 [Terriglobales bacterium]|jgi:hypothetical protein